MKALRGPIGQALLTIAVATSGAATSATAQEPVKHGRVATVIAVVDDSGARAGGVDVLLFADPWCTDPAGEPDMVRAVTDERGRVVVRLLPQRHYTVAASRRSGKAFAAACVDPNPLLAGAAASLKLGKVLLVEPRFLAGLDPWRAHGPLRVEVSPLAEGAFFFGVDEHQSLPVRRMRVLDKSGSPIWEGERADALANGMPPPQQVTVRVKRGNGRTMAGVEIWQRAPSEVRNVRSILPPPRHDVWRLLGKTGKDGEAQVDVAVRVIDDRVAAPILLEARADGLVPGHAGILAGGLIFRNHVVKPAPKDHVLEFLLLPPRELTIVPEARYHVVVMGKRLDNDVAPHAGPLELTTSAKGKVRLPLHARRGSTQVMLLERDGHEPVWSGLGGALGPCHVSLDVAAVSVSVRDPQGNPCRDAHVAMMTLHDQSTTPSFAVPLRLDPAGRCDVHWNRGQQWLLFSHKGDDLAWQYVAADIDISQIVLEMKPAPRATVQVLTAMGAPALGGLRVMIGGSRNGGLRTDEGRFVSFLQTLFDEDLGQSVVLDKFGRFSKRLMPGMTFDMHLTLPGIGASGRGAMVSGEHTEIALR